jgi:CubicO group peptidase (beta-lactamase class C family)
VQPELERKRLSYKPTHRMNIKRAFLISVAVILSITMSLAQESISDQIDQLMNKAYPEAEPGAAILVAKEGKVIFRKGYGQASLNPNVANTPEKVFRIGSITKQFTSTAILKLVEQGKIQLSADITTYLPGFTIAGKTVTVEQLLNHTSGIKSYTSLPDMMTKEKKAKSITIDEMLRVIQSQPSDFNPNDQWLYNNSGYYLLGAMIEKVSGMTYGEYVTKNLFKPAGMKTSFTDDSKLPKGGTIGYQKENASDYIVSDYIHPTVPFSAGAIFSTVDDLWKWNQAIFNYTLVKEELLEKAWTPTKLNDGTLISYGYGWQLGRVGEFKTIGHGGGIDGYLTFEMYIPDQKIYITILSNRMTVNPEEYVYQVAEIVTGINKQMPTVISLEESVVGEYPGVYKINEKEERIITRKGNQFFSQRTGGTKFEIFPYAKDAFFFKDSGSKLTFMRNSLGNVEAVELKGREFVPQVATKTNKPIPSDREEIELDPLVFDRYVGEYELAPGFIIKVWREEKVFKAQATGQPFFEIFAESENRFFLKVVDAQIEFKKDDSGGIASMTLFQGGREMPGKKIK